jgi:S-adenosylmethionine hydrolase
VITLLTDFGTSDSYVAQMKGIILTRAPGVRIVDVTHEIPPQDTFRAACVLAETYPRFPKGSIHVAVVDPGVGSERRVLCLASARQLFLAPDNGLVELVIRRTGVDGLVAVTSDWYFQASVSATFHGRDVVAPVAGHLANGARLAHLGPTISDPVRLDVPEVTVGGQDIIGVVIHIDRFGNLISNIEREHLARIFQGAKSSQLEVSVAGRKVRGLSRSFSDAPEGELLCYVGSSDRLEIAVSGGSAAAELGASRGDAVAVFRL